jgi:hypothetical protein
MAVTHGLAEARRDATGCRIYCIENDFASLLRASICAAMPLFTAAIAL